ncbi:MAG: energy-coupling factor ABC transporter ATP-binding protein [Treponema sp.]|jgi:cobalt/nickel transport system ATP-binding protein|nr:energy-coupling factor ABC transporter ATP-binding protein [Treponema sp.]
MKKLSVSGITYTYEGGLYALDGVTFDVQKGSCLCVAGANGSGKSTLLALIAGCMKPARGDIYIDGISIFKQKNRFSDTGIVFQEPDNQLFMPTVWEDVAFALLKKGMSAAAAKETALAALRMVDAEYIAERAPYKLSGGEKQRAAIASVLSAFQGNIEDKILLVDEPSAALDPHARKNIIALLRRLSCTKIIASHDLDLVLDLADRVLFLYKNHVAGDSPVKGRASPGLLSDEAFLQSIGLELPLTFC